MGYNRSGNRRTKRMKRAKLHNERLALKASAQEEQSKPQGLLAKVKKVAATAASAVGGAAHAVADKVRGKH